MAEEMAGARAVISGGSDNHTWTVIWQMIARCCVQ
jgi:hypothetical protein